MDIKRNNEKPITMDDLALPFLKQASKGSSSTLKRKLVALSDRQSLPTKGKGNKETRKKTSSKTPDIISAPLPKVTQDRIQRNAAYSESSKNISKWLPVVMENRKADHLSFPLNEASNTTRVSSATLVAKFEPATTLEHEIESILKKGTESTAALKNGALTGPGTQSLEEMKNKQIELQKMRSFLFYQEQKMKKSAKIKSKSYHRIMKKEKLKAKLAVEDETAQMKQRMKREMERIKERMTLRHRGSQRQLHQGNTATDKQLVTEELKRIEALKKKVALDSSDSEIQSDESEEEEGDEHEHEHDAATAHKKSSLFNMKFMQREKTTAATKEPETEEEDDDNDNNLSESGQSQEDEDNMPDSTTYSDGEEEEEEEHVKEEKEPSEPVPVGRKQFKKSGHETNVHSGPSGAPLAFEKPSIALIESPFTTETGASHAMSASQQPSCQSDLNPWSELDTSNFSIMPRKKNLKKLKEEASSPASHVPLIGLSDENDDGLVLKDDTHIRLQKGLIQQAFANDDVFREFEEEKSKVMEEDAPKDKDVTLPGWGSWGGAGVDLSQVKRIIKKARPGEGIQPNQRKDAKLQHVIINEKKIKSIAKYQVDQVPYPFENKLQYEASQRMPVGKEWNTLSAYRNQIRPRVQTKTGTIIAPLKYAKKNATEPA